MATSDFGSSMVTRLPPCGGSGLKLPGDVVPVVPMASPSMRREWIEIFLPAALLSWERVSLHAEGVD